VNRAASPGVANLRRVWDRPIFNAERLAETPAYVLSFSMGLVQNTLSEGETRYIGQPFFKKYDYRAIKLQGRRSQEPISFQHLG